MPVAQEQNSWGFLLGWGKGREESWGGGVTSPLTSHLPSRLTLHHVYTVSLHTNEQGLRIITKTASLNPPQTSGVSGNPHLGFHIPHFGNQHSGASRSERKRSKRTSPMLNFINDRDRRGGCHPSPIRLGYCQAMLLLAQYYYYYDPSISAFLEQGFAGFYLVPHCEKSPTRDPMGNGGLACSKAIGAHWPQKRRGRDREGKGSRFSPFQTMTISLGG